MTRVLTIPVVVASLLLLAGCPSEYQLRLYNFSGDEIESDQFFSKTTIDDGDSALLYDRLLGEKILLPEKLRLEVNGQERCFDLGQIREGGYGQRDETGEVVVRFKITGDEEIYVYRVAESEFNALGSPGPQPNGYPASSSRCD